MDAARAASLFRDAGAGQWDLPADAWAAALDRSATKALAGRSPSSADLDRYFSSLHLADLALACACAQGHAGAWDHFVAQFRPALYRAADAVDAGGGAREVADALYAELYGLNEKGGERRSLFLYFHGRSSLSTWLRSLVAQRYVDRIRETRRLAPLPEDESAAGLPAAPASPDPDRPRFAAAMRAALGLVIGVLAPKDRLRLGCYYAQEMTLAQIGRVTGEHEATVSRHLARTRREIRGAVERQLREQHRFAEREIDECFASMSADVGPINLGDWFAPGEDRKKPDANRSNVEDRREP
jgi:RNA polymerase sigma-70 factor (ECF subfamily)